MPWGSEHDSGRLRACRGMLDLPLQYDVRQVPPNVETPAGTGRFQWAPVPGPSLNKSPDPAPPFVPGMASHWSGFQMVLGSQSVSQSQSQSKSRALDFLVRAAWPFHTPAYDSTLHVVRSTSHVHVDGNASRSTLCRHRHRNRNRGRNRYRNRNRKVERWTSWSVPPGRSILPLTIPRFTSYAPRATCTLTGTLHVPRSARIRVRVRVQAQRAAARGTSHNHANYCRGQAASSFSSLLRLCAKALPFAFAF